jgi:hypothetical protein
MIMNFLLFVPLATGCNVDQELKQNELSPLELHMHYISSDKDETSRMLEEEQF